MRVLVNISSTVPDAEDYDRILGDQVSEHVRRDNRHLSRAAVRRTTTFGKLAEASSQIDKALAYSSCSDGIERFNVGDDGFEVFGRLGRPDDAAQINRLPSASGGACPFPMT